jgi:hypothetical protein
MESHPCDNQKTEKDSIFKQGQVMRPAAASVIISAFMEKLN